MLNTYPNAIIDSKHFGVFKHSFETSIAIAFICHDDLLMGSMNLYDRYRPLRYRLKRMITNACAILLAHR